MHTDVDAVTDGRATEPLVGRQGCSEAEGCHHLRCVLSWSLRTALC